MNRTHRLAAFALSIVVTLSLLSTIDLLARTEHAAAPTLVATAAHAPRA